MWPSGLEIRPRRVRVPLSGIMNRKIKRQIMGNWGQCGEIDQIEIFHYSLFNVYRFGILLFMKKIALVKIVLKSATFKG